MRILITGAAGFLGKVCSTHFKNSSSFDVITTDKALGCDLLGDLSDLKFVKSLPEVDIVINCAAVQYVTKNKPLLFRREFFKKNNVESIKNLVARYHGSDVHFVNIGTSMQYFQDGSERYTEKSRVSGQGIYSESKVEAYDWLGSSSIRCCTIVPSIIGGLGREGLFRGFVNSILTFGIAFVPGSGLNPISMVHVDDVVSLIDIVVRARAIGTYNASASNSLCINQWIEVVANVLKRSKVSVIHLPLLPIYILSLLSGFRILAREQLLMLKLPHVIDISASRAIGWSPTYSCEQIITDIVLHVAKKG